MNIPPVLRAALFALAGAGGVAHGVDASRLDGCRDCHRPAARAVDSAPVIEGQQREYLDLQLRRFRDRHRKAFPMDALAEALTDEDAAALAALAAERQWTPSQATRSDELTRAAGAAVVEARACTACHGDDFRGAGVIPRLAGQHAVYLERQIRGFAQGRRYHPPTGIGARMYGLDANEVAALAAYLQALGNR